MALDSTLVARAAELAATDGEFHLNARLWTGTLTLVCDGTAWRLGIADGRPDGAPVAIDADGPAGDGADDGHTVTASAAAWDRVLAAVPPPGYVDPTAAAAIGEMTVSPPTHTAERQLALRRFVELLRHARNGTDPAPVPSADTRPHGSFDAAVGRYVHLHIDGLDHRVYFEEAGSGIGLLCQHTAGADGRQFRRFLEDERITSRFRVVVYDLPYHGKSLPPAGRAWWAEPYKLTREFAMALPMTLAATLGIERPVFIGSSVGGMLALDLARFHPEAFRASIALEGGLRVELGFEIDAIEGSPLDENDPALHAATMMMIMSPTAPEADRQETRLHYAQGAPSVFPGDIHYYAIDHDLRGEAGNFDLERCPVHLLTGEYDFPTMPWTQTAADQMGIPMTNMIGLGHFPMSEDHEGLMRYVLPILDAIAEQGA